MTGPLTDIMREPVGDASITVEALIVFVIIIFFCYVWARS